MKPLTIEELRALQVGDWVWVVELDKSYSHYVQLREVDYKIYGEWLHGYKSYEFASYGTKWLAYKNKEQAEQKEKCVICHMSLKNVLPKIDKYGNHYCNGCYAAKCKLENIKAAKQANNKRDLYQTAFELILQDVYDNRLQVDVLSCSSCPFMEVIFDECENQGLYEDCKKRWKDYYLSQAKRRLAELKGENV